MRGGWKGWGGVEVFRERKKHFDTLMIQAQDPYQGQRGVVGRGGSQHAGENITNMDTFYKLVIAVNTGIICIRCIKNQFE
jgi:hypothetical protein